MKLHNRLELLKNELPSNSASGIGLMVALVMPSDRIIFLAL